MRHLSINCQVRRVLDEWQDNLHGFRGNLMRDLEIFTPKWTKFLNRSTLLEIVSHQLPQISKTPAKPIPNGFHRRVQARKPGKL